MNDRLLPDARYHRPGCIHNQHSPNDLIGQISMHIDGVITHEVRSRLHRVDRIRNNQRVCQITIQRILNRCPCVQINTPRLHRNLTVTQQTDDRWRGIHHLHRPCLGGAIPGGITHVVAHAVTAHGIRVHGAHARHAQGPVQRVARRGSPVAVTPLGFHGHGGIPH